MEGSRFREYITGTCMLCSYLVWMRLMLTSVLLHKWSTLMVDFVLAYLQDDVESKTYTKLPRRNDFGANISRETHVLKLLKSIYGLKQAGCVWNKRLHHGLMQLKFEQSKYDPCFYYRFNVVMGFYIDYCLIIAPIDAEIMKVYAYLKTKFEVTNKDPIYEYLGVKVEGGQTGQLNYHKLYSHNKY